jgi:hypothetical protein
LATTALLAVLTPVAGAEDDEALVVEWRCVPAQDARATIIQQAGATYYQLVYPNQGYYIEELWKESNGEGGLQTSAGMSCVGRADTLVFNQCVGFCPLRF